MPRLIVSEAASPVQMPTASPASFGAGSAQALQRTGGMMQALGQVLNQYAESTARVKVIQYEQDLSAEAEAISMDPDIQGRAKKFDEAQRRLIDKHRPGFGSRNTYDQRASLSTGSIRSQFQARTMQDGIKESRLNTDLEVMHSMMKAANADSDEDAAASLLEAERALSESALYYTPAEQAIKLQTALGQGIRAMADTNPERALRVIDFLGPKLGPEVTAVYREEAMNNIRQAAARRVAEAKEQRRLMEQAEKDASRAAEERLIAADAAGDLSPSIVAGEVQNLSPTAYLRWARRAKGDSPSSGAVNDPTLYMELTDRAEAGDDVWEDATAAVTAGAISADKRNALVQTSRDARFKPARAHIKTALGVNPLNYDPERAEKLANALVAFDEWVIENPRAPREESFAKAQELVSLGKQRARASRFAGKTLKTPEDVRAQMKIIRDQRAAGVITPESYAEKLKNLEQALLEIQQMEENAGGQP